MREVFAEDSSFGERLVQPSTNVTGAPQNPLTEEELPPNSRMRSAV